MLKKLMIVVRKVCTAIFILYGFNLILSAVNVIIPINIINVALVTVLGFPGLFVLVLMFFII